MADHFVDDILPNKLGIKNSKELMQYEEKIVAEKIITLLKDSETIEPDIEYFKHIHRVLFEDLYDFAGQFRQVDIVKQNSNYPFAFAQFIAPESNRIFNELKAKNLSVITAEVSLSNARIARNDIMYKENSGLVFIAVDVKTYIKSVFGATSPQFKQTSNLKFRNYMV